MHGTTVQSCLYIIQPGIRIGIEDLSFQYKVHTIAQVHVQISEGVCGRPVPVGAPPDPNATMSAVNIIGCLE